MIWGFARNWNAEMDEQKELDDTVPENVLYMCRLKLQ